MCDGSFNLPCTTSSLCPTGSDGELPLPAQAVADETEIGTAGPGQGAPHDGQEHEVGGMLFKLGDTFAPLAPIG